MPESSSKPVTVTRLWNPLKRWEAFSSPPCEKSESNTTRVTSNLTSCHGHAFAEL